MTALLQYAIEAVGSMPAETQDELARILRQLTGEDQAPSCLSLEEEAAVMQSRTVSARGEFATDEQVRAVWINYGQWGSGTRRQRLPISIPS